MQLNSDSYLQNSKIDLSISSLRILCLYAMLLYPMVGVLNYVLIENVHDPIWLRGLITALVAAFYFALPRSRFLQSKINLVVPAIYYFLTSHLLYITFTNSINIAFTIGLLILISASSAVFNNIRSLFFYVLFISLAVAGTVQYTPAPQIDPMIFFTSVVIMGSVTLIILKIRLSLVKRLVVADNVVNQMNALILVSEKNGSIVYASPSIFGILGYSDSEVLGDGWWKTQNRISMLGERNSKQAGSSGILRITKSAYDELAVKKNGDACWLRWSTSVQPDGELIIGVAQDVTAEKQDKAELQKLSLLASKTENYVIITDEEDIITWVNEGFTKITGYSSDEALGQHPSFLRSELTAKDQVEEIEHQARSGQPFESEILNQHKDGKLLWLSLSVSPIVDQESAVEGFITIGNDITERKLAEEKLRQEAFRLATIHKIDQAFLKAESFEEVAETTLELVLDLFPKCIRASFMVYDVENNRAKTIAESFTSGKEMVLEKEFPLDSLNAAEPILAGKEFLANNLSEVRQLSKTDRMLLKMGVVSYALIPIVYNKNLLGSLNLCSDEANAFDSGELKSVKGIARDLAFAIYFNQLQQAVNVR